MTLSQGDSTCVGVPGGFPSLLLGKGRLRASQVDQGQVKADLRTRTEATGDGVRAGFTSHTSLHTYL